MRLLAAALTVDDGRRDGNPETRVTLNYGFPAPVEVDEAGGIDESERWRLRTASKRIPSLWRGDREALETWNRARDDKKGRALVAQDQKDDGVVAALMSWHYDDRKRGTRPHLVTSIALRDEPALHEEYLIAAWLLCLVGLAIDLRTTKRGRIGLTIDKAIALPPSDLAWLGWKRGPKSDDYKGDYFVLTGPAPK